MPNVWGSTELSADGQWPSRKNCCRSSRQQPPEATSTEAVIREGQRSGPGRAWLSRGDARVLAATQMLSGGAHASVSFPAERLSQGEDYIYFCSFPPHAEPMRGKLVVID